MSFKEPNQPANMQYESATLHKQYEMIHSFLLLALVLVYNTQYDAAPLYKQYEMIHAFMLLSLFLLYPFALSF